MDFPNFKISEARWEENQLYLRVRAKNKKLRNIKTKMKLVNVEQSTDWTLTRVKTGEEMSLKPKEQFVSFEASENDGQIVLSQKKDRTSPRFKKIG